MRTLLSMLDIASKDIMQRLRDRSAIIMGVVGPLALALVLGGTLGSVDDPAAFEFGFADDDGGLVAQGFEQLLGNLERDDIVVVTSAVDRAELERLVDSGEVAAGFHIPTGFSDAVQGAQPAVITVVGDPGSPIATDVAEAIATTFAAELDYVSLATASVLTTERSGVSADRVTELTAAAQAEPAPIELVAAEATGKGQDLSSYYAVSISVFFLFFTVQFGVLSLIEEREVGTLDRILMAPISSSAILLGKLMSSLVVGVVSMLVLVLATTVVVGAEWGDPLGVSVLILFGVLAASSVAALVAAMAKTAEQAVSYASAAALVLGLLGGTFFPISRAGGLLSKVSFISPHRWLLDGFRDLSYGAGVGDLGSTLTVLSAFILVAGGIGLAAANKGLAR